MINGNTPLLLVSKGHCVFGRKGNECFCSDPNVCNLWRESRHVFVNKFVYLFVVKKLLLCKHSKPCLAHHWKVLLIDIYEFSFKMKLLH